MRNVSTDVLSIYVAAGSVVFMYFYYFCKLIYLLFHVLSALLLLLQCFLLLSILASLCLSVLLWYLYNLLTLGIIFHIFFNDTGYSLYVKRHSQELFALHKVNRVLQHYLLLGWIFAEPLFMSMLLCYSVWCCEHANAVSISNGLTLLLLCSHELYCHKCCVGF